MEIKRIGEVSVYLNPSEEEQLLVTSNCGVVVEASRGGELADPEAVLPGDLPFIHGDRVNADRVVVNAIKSGRCTHAETIEYGKPVTLSTGQQKQSKFDTAVAHAIDRAINSFE
jgi:hypothetical protein